MTGNYKQRLLDLSGEFDPVFRNLQRSYSDEKLSNWIVALLISPFTKKSFWKIIKTLIPLILTGFISIGIITSVNATFPIKVIAISIAIILALIIMYLIQFFKMIDFTDSDNFHIGAYRVAKKKEYKVFINNMPLDFSFKGLYDEVVTHNPTEADLKVRNEMIEEQKAAHKEYVEQAEKLLQEAKQQRLDLLEQASMVTDLLKEVINILYQIVNDEFEVYQFKIISGFTIYEKETFGDQLIKVADIGTSGISSHIINIPPEITKDNQAVIRALLPKKDRYEVVYDKPYKNRLVISYSMEMKFEKTWIFNFHVDDNNIEALFYLLSDDIMDVRETYRLIHALCLILQQKKGMRSCGEKLL